MIHTVSSLAINTLAQTSPVDVESAAEAMSIWSFVLKGGVMMIPIGVCSLVTIAVATERAISLRKSTVIPPLFMSGLNSRLSQTPTDPGAILDYCKKHDSAAARVFAAGAKRMNLSLETIERHISEAGERELYRLRKNMRALSIIAAVSPLLGLLGTIFGMIAAFQTVALSGDALGRTELLASGIYEALITTAAGLIVAIPALISYHWLSAKIDKLINEIDLLTLDFIDAHALPIAGESEAAAPIDNGAMMSDRIEVAPI